MKKYLLLTAIALAPFMVNADEYDVELMRLQDLQEANKAVMQANDACREDHTSYRCRQAMDNMDAEMNYIQQTFPTDVFDTDYDYD